jgi:hypothetical protein
MIAVNLNLYWQHGFPNMTCTRNVVSKGVVKIVKTKFGCDGLWVDPPHAILVSDWSISKKSSPLKVLSHMNRNLVGSIYMYGRKKFYRVSYIDSSCQVWFHLAKEFQGRRFV